MYFQGLASAVREMLLWLVRCDSDRSGGIDR